MNNTFPIEHKQLRSLSEAAAEREAAAMMSYGEYEEEVGCANDVGNPNPLNTCPGYGITCGDNLDADETLCDRCQDGKDLDDRDGEPDADFAYPHLLD